MVADIFEAIQFIGSALEKKYGIPINFFIAGSFVASYIAKLEFGMDLAYNDIDIFIMADQLPKEVLESITGKNHHNGYYLPTNRWSILHVSWLNGILPNSIDTLNVIIIQANASLAAEIGPLNSTETNSAAMGNKSDLYLANLLDSFDINAVQVGVNVYYRASVNKWTIHVESWRWTEAFEQFTKSKILSIVDPAKVNSAATSLIRLVFKGNQLRLDFNLPSPPEVHEHMSDSLIGESTYSKWQMLPPVIKHLPQFKGLTFYGPFRKAEHPYSCLPCTNGPLFYYVESTLKSDKDVQYKYSWFANCRSGVTGIRHEESGEHLIRMYPCITEAL